MNCAEAEGSPARSASKSLASSERRPGGLGKSIGSKCPLERPPTPAFAILSISIAYGASLIFASARDGLHGSCNGDFTVTRHKGLDGQRPEFFRYAVDLVRELARRA